MSLHIFKSATHTNMHGANLPLSSADLLACSAFGGHHILLETF
ncbi:hypothetical protein [Brenneria izbisi]|nr:hypothetical protein [Brenneria izbisi]